VAWRRGQRWQRWTGSGSVWFDVMLIGALLIDMVVEISLAVADRIRRAARHVSQSDRFLSATSTERAKITGELPRGIRHGGTADGPEADS
jgi:hypothetical protein